MTYLDVRVTVGTITRVHLLGEVCCNVLQCAAHLVACVTESAMTHMLWPGESCVGVCKYMCVYVCACVYARVCLGACVCVRACVRVRVYACVSVHFVACANESTMTHELL